MLFSIKDRVLIGTTSGMIATLFKDLSNLTFYKLGMAKYTYFQLAASAHLLPGDIMTPIGVIIGVLGDIITGGAIGVVAILFFNLFGLDYWWYKGLIIGNAVWLFGLGVILNLGTINLDAHDPLFRLLALVDHLLFGLILTYTIYRWPKKKINRWSKN